jgi:hypothetical protein
MRALLPLVALVALSVAGCSSSANSVFGPVEDEPASACAGNSGNCGGGQHNNNPNNPPKTTP